MKSSFYTVCILVGSSWKISRYFDTVRAARNWGKWTSKKWQTKIYRGGPGGEVVSC